MKAILCKPWCKGGENVGYEGGKEEKINKEMEN
jgi:hypothetical protein